jgi:hypothetical protein
MLKPCFVNIEKIKRFSEFSEDFYSKKLLRGFVIDKLQGSKH